MEYLFTEVIFALISSAVVGISSAQFVVDLQRGIKREKMILVYFNTMSFSRKAIQTTAKKMVYECCWVVCDKVRTPFFLVHAIVIMFLMAQDC